MEERPFRIREVEGSNPSVSNFSTDSGGGGAAQNQATERIELSTPGLRDLCSATELSSHSSMHKMKMGSAGN